MHHQNLVILRGLGDGGEGLVRIEVAVVGDDRGHDQRTDVAEQQRIAVGGARRDRPGADRARGAAPVLDDDGLAEDLRQALGDDAAMVSTGPPAGTARSCGSADPDRSAPAQAPPG